MKPPAIKKIGKYEVQEEIGSGGFSTVFKCIHKETGAICAVKIGNASVWREYEKKKNRVESMVHMEEWAAYRALKYGKGDAQEHGIPAVYETGLLKLSEREIYPYLIMQLLGRHLGRELSKSTFTRSEFFTLARKMLRALQFLHESGLVHRDIKPSNFCTDHGPNGDKRVYLLDMGFACNRPTSGDDKFGDFVGTPDYSSSPALRGYRQGPRDDLESLGYGFLEMWLGDLPWYLTSDFSAEGGWTAESLELMADTRDKKWKSLAEAEEIPEFLVKWIEYSKNLNVLATPSYTYLCSLMPDNQDATLSSSKRKPSNMIDEKLLPVNPSKKIRLLEPEE